MENRDELLEIMRRLVKEQPETAAQVLARLVTRFEVTLVVHRQEDAPGLSDRWMVSVSESAGSPPETH